MLRVFVFIAVSLLHSFAFGQTLERKIDSFDSEKTLTKKVNSLMSYCYSNELFNGTILISKGNKIVYQKSFGQVNPKLRRKIDSDTIFYLASVSKQFTAMGIMILKEKGHLSFDDKLIDFVPGLPKQARKITIRHLLNHSSGITDREYYRLTNSKTNASNKDVLKLLKQSIHYKHEPGEKFEYSNFGYVLLATIIEKVSAKTIAEFFEKEIFQRINMDRTTTSNEKAQNCINFAKGKNLFGEIVQRRLRIVGPGGIYSTIGNLHKWNQALNSNTLVSKETMKEAFQSGSLNDGKILIDLPKQKVGYGFGWITYRKGAMKIVQHDGRVDGYRSLIKKNLSTGFDYIILVNNGRSTPLDSISESINLILETGKYQQPKIPVENKIVKEFSGNPPKVAIEKVLNALKESPKKYDVNENQINRMGYHCLNQKKLKVALRIFKLNTTLYPNSFNAFDSLAEALFRDKQFDKAKLNYKKSLELNPKNDNAFKMLQNVDEAIRSAKN